MAVSVVSEAVDQQTVVAVAATLGGFTETDTIRALQPRLEQKFGSFQSLDAAVVTLEISRVVRGASAAEIHTTVDAKQSRRR